MAGDARLELGCIHCSAPGNGMLQWSSKVWTSYIHLIETVMKSGQDSSPKRRALPNVTWVTFQWGQLECGLLAPRATGVLCSGDCLLPCCLLPQHDVFSPVDFRHMEQMCSCLWTVDATGFQARSWLTLAYHRAAPTSALVGSPVSPGFPTSIPIASRQVPMFLFLLSLLVEHVLPSLAPRLEKGPVLPTHTPPACRFCLSSLHGVSSEFSRTFLGSWGSDLSAVATALFFSWTLSFLLLLQTFLNPAPPKCTFTLFSLSLSFALIVPLYRAWTPSSSSCPTHGLPHSSSPDKLVQKCTQISVSGNRATIYLIAGWSPGRTGVESETSNWSGSISTPERETVITGLTSEKLLYY